jgi:hypothetical protein
MPSIQTPLNGKTALIVAHPGHELRVHRWIELAQPTVFVLTDGSGRTQRSRLPSTTSVLERAGARPGTLYGCCSDSELYAAVLAGDTAFLLRMMRTLVEALIALDVEAVVADALEGFNPSHDICRFVVNATVSRIERETGRVLRNFDFLLDGSPEQCPAPLRASAVCVELDDADLERKLAAADGYPELQAEKVSALARYGTRPFRTELLRPVPDCRQGLDAMEQEPPYYERFGEQQVTAGYYRDVIRYRENVRPLVQALWKAADLNATEDRGADTASADTAAPIRQR